MAPSISCGTRFFSTGFRGRRHDTSKLAASSAVFFSPAIQARSRLARAIYSLMVLTTLDSGRVLLLAENLSCARTMSSYFKIVVTGCFGTMCTTL
jgi:hypothetical protein